MWPRNSDRHCSTRTNAFDRQTLILKISNLERNICVCGGAMTYNSIIPISSDSWTTQSQSWPKLPCSPHPQEYTFPSQVSSNVCSLPQATPDIVVCSTESSNTLVGVETLSSSPMPERVMKIVSRMCGANHSANYPADRDSLFPKTRLYFPMLYRRNGATQRWFVW